MRVSVRSQPGKERVPRFTNLEFPPQLRSDRGSKHGVTAIVARPAERYYRQLPLPDLDKGGHEQCLDEDLGTSSKRTGAKDEHNRRAPTLQSKRAQARQSELASKLFENHLVRLIDSVTQALAQSRRQGCPHSRAELICRTTLARRDQ
jgi:hypothetical protein